MSGGNVSPRGQLVESRGVVVKISGDAFGVNSEESLRSKAYELLTVQALCAGRIVVACVGGGAGNRGRELSEKGNEPTGLEKVQADVWGMNASIRNAGTLFAALRDYQSDNKPPIVGWRSLGEASLEEHNRCAPVSYLETDVTKPLLKVTDGGIIVVGGGTGMPGVSTDMGALWTGYLNREGDTIPPVFLKATSVDGVYDKDPSEYDDAQLLEELTYATAAEQGLSVVDRAAWPILEGNEATTVVFKEGPGQIIRVMRGYEVGTLVTAN